MASSKLFEPLRVGNITVKHRMIMAPLTRYRADDDRVPLPIVKEYYAQRGSTPGTLIVTEATFISPRASGYPNIPGLWTPEMLAGWKEVTDAVHAKGSFIFCQLWALGRAAPWKEMSALGFDVVSSSPVPISEQQKLPRELTEEEIHGFISDYATAAKAAVEIAGFDGVEIHGANGYLVDQFTQDICNKRTDKWGGSIENRARFGLEVTKAVVKAVGKERTAIRLSPYSNFQAMGMEDPVPQFSYLVAGLKEIGLAFLHLVEGRVHGNVDRPETGGSLDFIVDIWQNTSPIVLAGAFREDLAKDTVDKRFGDKDILIAFGRLFISNPDLPFRVENNIELSPYDRPTFYVAGSHKGYTDYPFSKEWEQQHGRL